MRKAAVLCGTASFIMAFLGGLLAFSLMAPPRATAQSPEPQEIQASAFTLVGNDGTVIARLAPAGPGQGNLTLFDASGVRRLTLAGAGTVTAFDADGSTVTFGAGLRSIASPVGEPAVNGVVLGSGGSVEMLP